MLAAQAIRAGDAETVVAGGMENMNLAPYLLRQARTGYRLGNGIIEDSAVMDGLWCAVEGCHMGTHAERVAIQDHVTREAQDAFALQSHQRAIAAIDAAASTTRSSRSPSPGRRGRRRRSRPTRALAATRPPRHWQDSSQRSTCPPGRIAATRRRAA